MPGIEPPFGESIVRGVLFYLRFLSCALSFYAPRPSHYSNPRPSQIGTWRNFTVQLAGISCPRQDAEGGPQSKFFVDLRLLNRCLDITIIGADKNGSVAVAKIHHPKGNIALEVLKSGLGNVSEWSARFLEVVEVAELRRTETAAKAARVGIWRGYVKPVVDGVSEAHGTVVEVVTGDTCTILMGGETYTSDEKVRMDMNWKSIAKIKICPSLSLFI